MQIVELAQIKDTKKPPEGGFYNSARKLRLWAHRWE